MFPTGKSRPGSGTHAGAARSGAARWLVGVSVIATAGMGIFIGLAATAQTSSAASAADFSIVSVQRTGCVQGVASGIEAVVNVSDTGLNGQPAALSANPTSVIGQPAPFGSNFTVKSGSNQTVELQSVLGGDSIQAGDQPNTVFTLVSGAVEDQVTTDLPACGGGTTTSSSPPTTTPPSSLSIKELKPPGIVVVGDTATVSETATGSGSKQLSLVSNTCHTSNCLPYTKQTIYRVDTKTVSAGEQTFTVKLPCRYSQIDFVYGPPIDLSSGKIYGGAKIDYTFANTTGCTTTSSSPPPTTTSSPPPVTSSSVLPTSSTTPPPATTSVVPPVTTSRAVVPASPSYPSAGHGDLVATAHNISPRTLYAVLALICALVAGGSGLLRLTSHGRKH